MDSRVRVYRVAIRAGSRSHLRRNQQAESGLRTAGAGELAETRQAGI